MKHGSLFSGIGGFDLAAEWMGWENVFHCEVDQWSRSVLEKKWPSAVSYSDIKDVDFTKHQGDIDVLTGGFPCQDVSNAKQNERGKGIEGDRSGLVYHMLRAITQVKPLWVVAENVSNLLKINGGRDFGIILRELARMGYNAEWRVLYASDVGAPHKRGRCYLVAHSNRLGLIQGQHVLSNVRKEVKPWYRDFARTIIQAWGEWDTEPPVLRLDDGFPRGLVRRHLKGYGNAVVPPLVKDIFKVIEELTPCEHSLNTCTNKGYMYQSCEDGSNYENWKQ